MLKLPRKCQRRQNGKITPSSAPPKKRKMREDILTKWSEDQNTNFKKQRKNIENKNCPHEDISQVRTE